MEFVDLKCIIFSFFLLSHYFLSIIFNAPTDTSRSRQELSNEYLIAKIGVDTAETDRSKFEIEKLPKFDEYNSSGDE